MYKQLIIDTCKKYGLSRDEAAYVLATTAWETNHTFKPVREAYWVKNAEAWRKRNLRYYPWYGRGFVQLTWKRNYVKAGKEIGVDLISDPDRAMFPENAAKILVLGMRDGWFTGKDLDDYIDGIDESAKEDFLEFYNARRIVNGMDKANQIAILAEKYEKELAASGYDKQPVKSPTLPDTRQDDSGQGGSSQNTFLRLLVALIRFIVKALKKEN